MPATKLHLLRNIIADDVCEGPTLKEVKRHDLFRLDTEISDNVVNHISEELIDDLVQTFGPSITIQVGRATNPPIIDDGMKDGNFQDTLDKHRGRNRRTKIQIDIDKSRLASHLGVDGDTHSTVIYLFKDRAKNTLRNLQSVEDELYRDPYTPVLLIICGSHASHTGPLLNVADLNTISDVVPKIQKPSSRMRSRIDQYRERVGTELNWTGFDLDVITPVHFMTTPTPEAAECGADDWEVLIRQMLFHASVVYTADRTENDGASLTSTYAGSEGTSRLKLEPELDGPADSELVRFALWPYLSMENDRLDVLRTVMVRELRSRPGANYSTLQANIGAILDEVRWHYRLFINQRIENHFARVKEVSDYITETTRQISNWVDSMTSSLVNTLLATLGLVVVTLLSSLVKQDGLPVPLIQKGIFLYACYIILFPCIYKMSNLFHSYSLLKQEFLNKEDEFKSRLGSERVNQKTKFFDDRKKQFVIWFAITAFIYVCVGLALFWLSDNISVFLASV